MKKADQRTVAALAVGETYDLVMRTKVTAHPAVSPYPKFEPEYVVPVMKGGGIERIFCVEAIIECMPGEIESLSPGLDAEQARRLVEYHNLRLMSFGYSKDDDPYRFYLLREHAIIIEPTHKKYVQICARMDYRDFKLDVTDDAGRLCYLSDESALDLETAFPGRFEGAAKLVLTTVFERDPANRAAAIEANGAVCQVCGFDFGKVYGALGEGFIEVHHTTPLHVLDSEVAVNPIKDLACVCSNCHRMLHRRKDSVVSVAKLREIVATSKGKIS